MTVGLRIDVDTFRGTRDGVPRLCEVLAEHAITASFFFSVGPDNMGRHLWRLLRPAFLLKMLRTRAGGLYGWDIFFKGTFWPGPVIGGRLAATIKAVSDAGHEIGFHAWDHHAWQRRIGRMDGAEVLSQIARGVGALATITGQPPSCSASPGWRCNDRVLKHKSLFDFTYNSDCRGTEIFYPVVDGVALSQPQIPVTLPTFDEVVGRSGVSPGNYNEYMLSQLTPENLNVLTVHAEVEGMLHRDLFGTFLKQAQARQWSFVRLGDLLRKPATIGRAAIRPGKVPGREGWVAVQAQAEQPGHNQGSKSDAPVTR